MSRKLSPEPLLSFPNGALVHFAVSNSEVGMTTRLEGTNTRFLPFNLGDNGAAGNPLNPNGHQTVYLWEQVWQRESWLEILGRYLVAERDDKKKLKAIIFPRYHQLDVTRKLQTAILEEGPGQKYLIQHSAGSGKTNSIAWLAHFLADLHYPSEPQGASRGFHSATTESPAASALPLTVQPKPNEKVFDTVLVISDRNVIDGQLRDAIYGFERTAGVVATIRGEGGSKSQKLADGGEISTEDLLAAHMANRASDKGITYVAFTATPKAKTLELFGRRPDPSKPAGEDNLPEPFHVYSMRQTIEEGFILDVLQNYTSYKLAFKLATSGEPQGASRGLRSDGEQSPAASALPLTEKEMEKAYLNEIIQKVNDLFKGELTDNDKLVYVNNVILGKLLESQTLIQQAVNNSKEQFANSPDLKNEIMNAIMAALDAHTTMSTQALGSEAIRNGLRDILLGPAKLYEMWRKQVENEGTKA